MPVEYRWIHLWTHFWTDKTSNSDSIGFRINFIKLFKCFLKEFNHCYQQISEKPQLNTIYSSLLVILKCCKLQDRYSRVLTETWLNFAESRLLLILHPIDARYLSVCVPTIFLYYGINANTDWTNHWKLVDRLYDTQGELRCLRNGIFVLWFISFSKITLHRGFKFDKFAFFYFCFAMRHLWLSEF